MRLEDMILVSVDDHISEPPQVFEGRGASRLRDRMPRVVHRKDGSDVWLFEGREIPNVGLNAVVGRRPEEYGMEPTAFDQMRRGVYDVHARIDDMNANGVLGSLNFASFPGFAGSLFVGIDDKALCLEVVRAYNDWHIEVWCGAHPERFIPLALLPLWDPALAAEEVQRVKRKGCNAVSFHPNPVRLGLPSLQRDHWNPLWAACAEQDVTVCLHIGDAQPATPSPDTPVDAYITNMPVTLFVCASDLLWSPILREFEGIRFALSEGGTGWVAYFLERADYVYRHHGAWTHQDFGDKLPSQVFLEHVYTCFIDDKTGIRTRDLVGIDNMTWECDYPHSDTTWPRSPEILWESLADVPEDEIHKITHRNAMRAFHFDPFAKLDRARCTVGALRAQATHVDTGHHETRGAGKAPSERREGPISMADIQRQLTGAAGSAGES